MTVRPRLPTIQVLRALSALIVAIGHAVIEIQGMPGNPGYLPVFYHGFGVSVFFVISGFIMAYTTEDDFGSAQGRKDFVVSRLTRIVPIYWLLTSGVIAVTLVAPSILHSPAPTVSSLLNSYLFLPFKNADGFPFPILAPGWSLDYEMYFYALFVLAMFLPRVTGLRVLVSGMIIVALLGIVLRPKQDLLSAWSNPCILRFVLGIGIAYYRNTLARWPAWAAFASIALGVALYVSMNGMPRPDPTVFSLIETLAAGAIVLGVATLDLRGTSVAPMVLVMIGDASYSLYLSHMFVVRLVRIAWNATHFAVEPIVFCGLVLAVAIPLAILLAARIELPLHRYLRRLLIRRPQVTEPATLEVRG